jgi:hypothetical protein
LLFAPQRHQWCAGGVMPGKKISPKKNKTPPGKAGSLFNLSVISEFMMSL